MLQSFCFTGWAATAKFNQSVRDQFASFRERKETFSIGVCNGCQLMALLGWVAPDGEGMYSAGSIQEKRYKVNSN